MTTESVDEIHIFTDGACNSSNIGGWAYIVLSVKIFPRVLNDETKTFTKARKEKKILHMDSGSEKKTTNNRMEITAVLEALKYVAKKYPFVTTTIICDSTYVVNSMSQWIGTWVRNNWITKADTPVKNAELWRECLLYTGSHVRYQWVRGHAGDLYNEMADEMAVKAIDESKRTQKRRLQDRHRARRAD